MVYLECAAHTRHGLGNRLVHPGPTPYSCTDPVTVQHARALAHAHARAHAHVAMHACTSTCTACAHAHANARAMLACACMCLRPVSGYTSSVVNHPAWTCGVCSGSTTACHSAVANPLDWTGELSDDVETASHKRWSRPEALAVAAKMLDDAFGHAVSVSMCKTAGHSLLT